MPTSTARPRTNLPVATFILLASLLAVVAIGPHLGRFHLLGQRDDRTREKIRVVIHASAGLGDVSLAIDYSGGAFLATTTAQFILNKSVHGSRAITPKPVVDSDQDRTPHRIAVHPASTALPADYEEEVEFLPFSKHTEGSQVYVKAAIGTPAFSPNELFCTIFVVGKDPPNSMSHKSTLTEKDGAKDLPKLTPKAIQKHREVQCRWVIHRATRRY